MNASIFISSRIQGIHLIENYDLNRNVCDKIGWNYWRIIKCCFIFVEVKRKLIYYRKLIKNASIFISNRIQGIHLIENCDLN